MYFELVSYLVRYETRVTRTMLDHKLRIREQPMFATKCAQRSTAYDSTGKDGAR